MSMTGKTLSIWIAVGFALAVLGAAMFSWPRDSESKSSSSQGSSPTNSVVGIGKDSTAEYLQRTGFAPTLPNKDALPSDPPVGMVWIPGGEFSMGCDAKNDSLCGMPNTTTDAGPIHRVYVDGFWMDETEVTNVQFKKFVDETGYVTVAEMAPTLEEFPNALPGMLVAGSTVFKPTDQSVSLNEYLQWWSYVKGANWRHPFGPESSIEGKGNLPVVHVCYEDAEAYAKWAGKRLPTEAEWEFAARGGQAGMRYSWGNELKVDGKFLANIYQGAFPVKDGDTGLDGFVGISPVKQYPPNGYGLYDTAGNVWEWVSDWYRPDYYAQLKSEGVVAKNPKGPKDCYDPDEPDQKKRVHRGGSFLCSDLYCTRYMLGTRGKGEVRTGSNHLGFRCVKSTK